MADHDAHDHTGVPGVGPAAAYVGVPASGTISMPRHASTFVTIATISLTAGDYEADGQVYLKYSSGQNYTFIRITDGAGTVLGSCEFQAPVVDATYYCFAGKFTLSGSATLTFEGRVNAGQASDATIYRETPDGSYAKASCLRARAVA